ncbi:T9SS type A sorting domain-containing protein [Cytophagaceae bacterium ABcell3]|nr:T9SS type A sorting domain-containing protein [Cytophagaceae bacterium ABcell3]
MKKILLSTLMSFATILYANAQIGDGFIHDDFRLSTDYMVSDEDGAKGLFWYDGPNLSVDRPGDGTLRVVGTGSEAWGGFGLSFGENPDGGVHSHDFGDNLDLRFTVTNEAETDQDTAHVTIVIGSDGPKEGDEWVNRADIHPDIEDVTNDWGDPGRKEKIQFVLNPGETKEIFIDLSSYGNIGGLKALSWDCGGPDECPETEYTLDISQIVDFNFSVNGELAEPEADRGIATHFVPYNGTLVFENFKIGDVPGEAPVATTIEEVIALIDDEDTEENSVSITWEDVADADEYIVAYSEEEETGYVQVTKVDGNTTDFTHYDNPDQPLTEGVTYYYIVGTVANGRISWSDAVATEEEEENETSAARAQLSAGLKIYPNPAEDGFAEVTYSALPSMNIEVKVVNMMGIEVLSVPGRANGATLNLSNLQGIYMVNIIADGEIVGAERVVVR